ncbi:hypothetical protein [Pontibacter sp. G13]|uniref:hypothetical protein n=1 Tax=Pontibacter sp. G13 TaxID=3074898 RepID=UPI002889A1F8|nr:hypothetical protein [Pontibacter sp. G13]WNJ18963.1 hypothetical protein RJD25_00610 [Pontibacter sp. G13]
MILARTFFQYLLGFGILLLMAGCLGKPDLSPTEDQPVYFQYYYESAGRRGGWLIDQAGNIRQYDFYNYPHIFRRWSFPENEGLTFRELQSNSLLARVIRGQVPDTEFTERKEWIAETSPDQLEESANASADFHETFTTYIWDDDEERYQEVLLQQRGYYGDVDNPSKMAEEIVVWMKIVWDTYAQ